ncbi:MAG TPA: hypothetical protein PKA27_09830 [Fimbriimonadaceae bacterium]|nr:hypothetical protein [Fimbriimonadaceae bacterium]
MDSLASRVARQYDLSVGSTYITVPFDCPESIDIDDLSWGQFYVETDHSVDGERYHAELETVSQTNEAIRELLRAGSHVAIAQLGLVTDSNTSIMSSGQAFVTIGGVGYSVLDCTCDTDTIYGALNDPIATLRFVSRVVTPQSLSGESILDSTAENLTFVAASIFDYMGYMLWWPR